MKNLIEYILIHLVNHPEDVVVEEQRDDNYADYTIKVNAEDVGRVIGKGGSVIHAIRKIAQIRAVKEGIRANVQIAEDDEMVGAKNEDTPTTDADESEITE